MTYLLPTRLSAVAAAPALLGIGFSTLTLNVLVAVLPAASVTVYLTEYLPALSVFTDPLIFTFEVIFPSLLSIALLKYFFALKLLPFVTVTEDLDKLIFGALISLTSTFNFPSDLFPAESIAVIFNVVEPISFVFTVPSTFTEVTFLSKLSVILI